MNRDRRSRSRRAPARTSASCSGAARYPSHRHLTHCDFSIGSAAGLTPHHLAHHCLELQAHGLGHHRRAEQIADDRRQRLGQLEARFVFEPDSGTPFDRNDRQVVAACKRTQCLRRSVDFAGLGARNDALVRLLRDGQAHSHRNIEKEQRKLSDVLDRQPRALARNHLRTFDIRQELAHVLIVGNGVPCDARIDRHTGARIHMERVAVALDRDGRQRLGARHRCTPPRSG